MFLKWGNYTHPLGEPQISISKQPVLSEGGVPIAHKVIFDIQGMLLAGGQAAMDAKIAEFLAAYAKQNQDMVLYLSDGVTESQHKLKVEDTRGGVWVTSGPNFPDGGGAEYATRRSFQVQIQGEVPVSDPAVAYLSFTETLSIGGGGPVFGHTETAFGFPVKQQLRARSVYTASQSGSAVGYSSWPPPALPIFGYSNLVRSPTITRSSPSKTGNSFSKFRTAWEYKFESAYPLAGVPTIR